MKAAPTFAASLFGTAVRHHQGGRLDEAAAAYMSVLRVAPDHADALHLLGVLEAQQGRPDRALPRLQRAAQLSAANPEIRLNLANVLLASGRGDEALQAYRTALGLRPDFREAHTALLRAIARIGAFLESENRAGEAVPLWREAIALAPDDAGHWVALARALETTVFIKRDPQLHDVLLRLLAHPAIDPNPVCHAILSYLRLAPGFTEACAQPDPPESIPDQNLFVRLLETAIVADPEIEATLTRWRAAALRRSEAAPLPLLCAIAAQCFATEYVYVETDAESAAVARLESETAAAFRNNEAVAPARVAILAAYRPLHRLPYAAAIGAADWPMPVDVLIRRQIAEPVEEERLRSAIPALTAIRDAVSLAVRDQYEANPYPRWRGVARPRPATAISDRLGTEAPEILVAGCGTGQHSAATAMRYPRGRVLAVDLSLASLGFALRRAREMGLANLDYAQADILELGALDRRFDIIESAGVLHHLDDPLAGWRVLTDLLKPGGLMLIALYSELARRPIVAARAFIATRGFDATLEGIRSARREILAQMDDSVVRRLRTNRDFYSASGCRDLLFHVQEHRFTLPRIASALEDLGLDFLGFDALGGDIAARFRARFPGDPQMRVLANWDAFERDNPDMFAGMYQFWVTKPPQTGRGQQ